MPSGDPAAVEDGTVSDLGIAVQYEAGPNVVVLRFIGERPAHARWGGRPEGAKHESPGRSPGS